MPRTLVLLNNLAIPRTKSGIPNSGIIPQKSDVLSKLWDTLKQKVGRSPIKYLWKIYTFKMSIF